MTRRPPSTVVLALVTTFALGVPGIAPQAPLAAQAGRIDTVAPSCAAVGDRVTITGIGFGAGNVKIAVGGVPARVVSATGNRATFVVPDGVSLGGTAVTALNPGGHAGQIAFSVCDLLLPGAWVGRWSVTIAYRNAVTGSLVARDDITTFIRSREPFGLGPIGGRAGCTGSVSDTHLEIHCGGGVRTVSCTIAGDVHVAIEREGETLLGSGAATTTADGSCGALRGSAQTVEVTGLRLSLDEGPPGASTSLVQSFVPHAAVLRRLAGGGA